MSDASRRGFLAMAGAGAAAAGVAVVATPASAAPAPAQHRGTAVEGTLVAQVRDVKTGRISVMVDGREVVVTDHALVAHLTSKLA